MSSPEQSRPEQPNPVEAPLGSTTVLVRRSPRYFNFMLLGGIVGVILALVGTVAFPDTAQFGQAQVFGFLLLLGVAVGVTLGCLVALGIDRITSRRATRVVADRLGVHESSAVESEEVSSDTHQSNELSTDQP